MLPLDLHVLGLSLAFILSQDQTLRCIVVICPELSPDYPGKRKWRQVVTVKTTQPEKIGDPQTLDSRIYFIPCS